MENYSVCQLQKDMRFEGFLLVRSAEKRRLPKTWRKGRCADSDG